MVVIQPPYLQQQTGNLLMLQSNVWSIEILQGTKTIELIKSHELVREYNPQTN